MTGASMLGDFRVLDLADGMGSLCGRILADFGADVIRIESPGGDDSRRQGPFYHNIHDPEKSLNWFFFNANKRGITLNIQAAEGRELFLKLVKTADVVIESFPVGYLGQLGLDYTILTEVNPRIILTSITPFGQQEPYAHFKGSDLVCVGMSGVQYMSGNPARPPGYISFPQAYLLAGAQAAIGTLTALHYCGRSGEGQHVDVSAQAAMACSVHTSGPAVWEQKGVSLKRVGICRVAAGNFVQQRMIHKCKDGYVAFFVAGGQSGAHMAGGLVDWMDEQGMAEDFLKELNWEELDLSKISIESFDRVQDAIGRFFLKHNKKYLYEEGGKRGVMLYPVQTIGEIAQSPQLAAREFWEEVEHPELGDKVTYPGSFVRFPGHDVGIRRRAPLIGEHNHEIYELELGLSGDKLSRLRQNNTI